MALIKELGTGAADSESYASVADADLYFSNRGMTNWTTLSNTEKEQALRRACDYIGYTYRSQFAGSRVNTTQALDFPRYNVPRCDGVASYYASDAIPKELVSANIELAIRAAAGELLSDVDPEVASEKVSSIEVHYFKGSSKIKRYPAIDKLLSVFFGMGSRLMLVRA
jgi:hypothetical protein